MKWRIILKLGQKLHKSLMIEPVRTTAASWQECLSPRQKAAMSWDKMAGWWAETPEGTWD